MRTFRLLFVSGASGSGTTLLAKILTSVPQVVAVAGKQHTIARAEETAFRLAKRINRTTREIWDRQADAQTSLSAKSRLPAMIQELLAFERHVDSTHVMIKRSAPFYKGDRYRPDILDMLELFPDTRILVIYRDPRASTYSSQRRGFAQNLRNMAVICEEQLIYLSAQLQAIDPALYKVIGYEAWMRDPVPITRSIAEFAGLPVQKLIEAVERSGLDASKNDQWQNDLSREDASFLDQFFSEPRVRRWAHLVNASR